MENLSEKIFSRSEFLFGSKFQSKISSFHVLLVNFDILGCEVARIHLLSGIKKLTIVDNCLPNRDESQHNPFLVEQMNQTSKAKGSLQRLQELNPDVVIKVVTDLENLLTSLESNEEDRINLAIFVNYFNKKDLMKWNQICRQNGIGFIQATCLGTYGNVFVDFGENFYIKDQFLNQPKNLLISSISNSNPAVITCVNIEERHFQEEDTVVVNNATGMTEINGRELKVKSIEYSEDIAYVTVETDTTNFSEFTPQKDAIATLEIIKVPTLQEFIPFSESLLSTDNICYDLYDPNAEFGPKELHLLYISLLEFFEVYGFLPTMQKDSDFNDVIEKVLLKMHQNNEFLKKQQALINQFLKTSRCTLLPLCSTIAALVSSESLKFSGKYTPLNQFLHFFDSNLPINEQELPVPSSELFIHEKTLFGRDNIHKFSDKRILIVGAGAIGSEYLRIFCSLGFGSGDNGEIIITDFDTISWSNLNRQFLYRRDDIGKNKAEVASARIIQYYPYMKDKIRFYKQAIRPDTEDIFNEAFWESLDLIVIAVDNVPARVYICEKAVLYDKLFFDAGTEGMICCSEPFIPFYSDKYIAPQGGNAKMVPNCTLKQFPSQTEHLAQYAREQIFEEEFVEKPKRFFNIVNTQSEQTDGRICKLRKYEAEQISNFFLARNNKFCIERAYDLFNELFQHNIEMTLKCYPPDSKDENGKQFWSAPKIMPKVVHFSAENPLHIDFIMSAATLYSIVYKFEQIFTKDDIEKTLIGIKGKQKESLLVDFELNEELNIQGKGALDPVLLEFDVENKDYMNFVALLTDIRATNYNLPKGDKTALKYFLGNISPSILSTTTFIVGLSTIEIIKALLQVDPKKLKAWGCYLHHPRFFFSYINQTNTQEINYKKFNLWDKICISGPKKVIEIVEEVEKMFNLRLSCITTMFNSTIYHTRRSLSFEKPIEELKESLPEELIQTGEGCVYIFLKASSKDKTIKLPLIKYRIKK